MPFYLKQLDVLPELKNCRSALIIVCRFCPAASQAAREAEPYMEVFRNGIKTGCFENLVSNMRSRLEDSGIRTGLTYGNLLNFIICMWTSYTILVLHLEGYKY